MLLTIITPTYNRENSLPILYKSLCSQTCKDFEWLIVDDGSIDETTVLVKNWIDTSDFKITYVKKENGGKHTALNIAFAKFTSDLMIIVDSDDYLTRDAVQKIRDRWKEIKEDESTCGMMFLIGNGSENKIFGCYFERDTSIERLKVLRKQNLSEKVYVIKRKFIEDKKFPEYENEKYVPEGYVWCQLENYNILAVNEVIYVGEYIADGLTKSGRRLRLNSINGMIDDGFMALSCGKIKFKNLLLIMAYYLYADRCTRNEIKERHVEINKLRGIYPVGFLLSRYWKIKYKDKK